jgi:CBS domain-containing protein
MGYDMLVKDVMSRHLLMVSGSDSVFDTVKLMVGHNISGLVVEREGKAVGVVTLRDVAKRVVAAELDPKGVKVADIMSHPVATVNELSSVESAAELMTKKGFRRLVVVDSANKVAGILTVKDVVSRMPELIDIMFKTWVTPAWK